MGLNTQITHLLQIRTSAGPMGLDIGDRVALSMGILPSDPLLEDLHCRWKMPGYS